MSETQENAVGGEAHQAVFNLGSIKPLPQLTLKENKIENWKLFKKRWDNYVMLIGLGRKDRQFQVAMFENCLADDAMKTLSGFSFDTSDANRTNEPNEITAKFQQYAIVEVNDTMERFIFHRRVQQKGDDFESFLSDVRTLAQTCKFCASCEKSIIRDRIVLGIRQSETREDLSI